MLMNFLYVQTFELSVVLWVPMIMLYILYTLISCNISFFCNSSQKMVLAFTCLNSSATSLVHEQTWKSWKKPSILQGDLCILSKRRISSQCPFALLVRVSDSLKVIEYVAFGLHQANCEITFRS